MAKSKVDEWLTKDKLILLEGWARDGLTEEQIAHNMGVNVKTLYNWKTNNLPILQALKKGKEVVDFEVENALLKRALGYTVTLNKQKVTRDGDVVDAFEEVHVAPDVTAQIFWLKNRKQKQWRDKIEYSTDTAELSKLDQLLGEIKNVAVK